MSHEREFDRTHSNATLSQHDADLAPNRATKSSLLDAPAHPIVSGLLFRKARDANGVAEGADAAVPMASGSSGGALPDTLMRKFESSLGADLSNVRVHTGTESQTAAEAVGAKAYTVGQDIHFGAGQFDPSSAAGQHLLAHEVAHTVQQAGMTPTRQNKLEVSSPFDAAEHDADRAADAMVAGAQANVTNAAGISRKIMRDQAPNTTTAPQSATVDQLDFVWNVDWQNKEVGSPVAKESNARTSNDSAQGELKVMPASDSQTAPALMRWVNAAKNGEVHAGTMKHGKGTGGTVTTDVAWGGHPSAAAVVTVTESVDDKKREGTSRLPAMQKAASAAASARLEQDLMLEGNEAALTANMMKAAKAAAPDGEGYTYDVKVGLRKHFDGNRGNARGLSGDQAVAYSGPMQDGDRRTLSIVVPTQTQKLMGDGSVVTEDMNSHDKLDEKKTNESTSSLNSVTVDTDTFTSIKTQVDTYFQHAWDDAKKKLTTHNLYVQGSAGGAVNAGAKAGASVKDLDVDLGILLAIAAVELGPGVQLLIKKAVGKGKVGATFDANIEAELHGDIGGNYKYSDEDLKVHLEKYNQQIRTSISSEVTTKVSTKVVIKSESASSGSTNKRQHDADSHKQTVASSSETVRIKYIIGEPALSVRKS